MTTTTVDEPQTESARTAQAIADMRKALDPDSAETADTAPLDDVTIADIEAGIRLLQKEKK